MSRNRRYWALLLVLCGLLLAEIVIVTKGVQEARQNAQRVDAVITFKQVMMGLRNYQDTYSRFPPASFVNVEGKATVSWRGAAIPFMQAGPPFWNIRISEGWRDDANRDAYDKQPWFYCTSQARRGQTRVFAVTGHDTVFGMDKQATVIDPDTIVLVEAVNSKTHWLEPGDVEISDIPNNDQPIASLPIVGETDVIVGFYDCDAWRLSAGLPCSVFRKFGLVSQAKTHDREELLAPYRIGQSP